KCRSNFRRCPWMDGVPETQEQFSAMSMDGRYAENAGAIFDDVHGWTVCRKRRSNFRRCPWMDGMPALPTFVWSKMPEHSGDSADGGRQRLSRTLRQQR